MVKHYRGGNNRNQGPDNRRELRDVTTKLFAEHGLNAHGGKGNLKKKPQGSRKEVRKQQRDAKKQGKNVSRHDNNAFREETYQPKQKIRSQSAPAGGQKAQKKAKSVDDDIERNIKAQEERLKREMAKLDEMKQTAQAEKEKKKEKKKPKKKELSLSLEQLANLCGPDEPLEALTPDDVGDAALDQEMEYLEQQLGLNKKGGKDKLAKEMAEEGWDNDLFSFCDDIFKGVKKAKKPSEVEEVSDEELEELEELEEEEEELLEEESDVEEMGNDVDMGDGDAMMMEQLGEEEEEEEEELEEEVSDEEMPTEELDEEMTGEEASDASELEEEDEELEEETDAEALSEEDSEPALKKRKIHASTPSSSSTSVQPVGTYLPPHLRKKQELANSGPTTSKQKTSAVLQQHLDQLRGLCNKLSEGNLDRVATETCQILKKALLHISENAKSEEESIEKRDFVAKNFSETLLTAAIDNPFMSVLVVACYAAIVIAVHQSCDSAFSEAVVCSLEKKVKGFCEKYFQLQDGEKSYKSLSKSEKDVFSSETGTIKKLDHHALPLLPLRDARRVGPFWPVPEDIRPF